MPSKEESLRGRSVEARALTIGMWGNLLMAVAGIAAAWLSNSDAVLIDGLYSGVNFAAAIVALRVGATIARRPDPSRPFGYDADEALYLTFRSLVLAGLLCFAAFNALAEITSYAAGGPAPQLVFGPIVVYGILMVTVCLALAWQHRRSWVRSGRRSDILRMEARAALIDGILSAGTALALFLIQFLRGTALEAVVPVADAIVVLVLVAVVGPQPVRVFLAALREIAGASAPEPHRRTAEDEARRHAGAAGYILRDLAVLKLGRSFFIVAYVDPQRPVAAEEIDAFNDSLSAAFRAALGTARCETVVTTSARHGAADR